jgi:enterochelin esterase-like enzyme
MQSKFTLWISLVAMFCLASAKAQNAAPQRPPAFVSSEVSGQREITFRIYAPQAKSARLSSSDLPGVPNEGLLLTKTDAGLWEGKTPAVPAGAYRYQFSVDGVSVIDPKNPRTSESNMNLWSLVQVSGSDRFDLLDVPHGAVAQLNYYSKPLKGFRRLHIYTPPGYDLGMEKLPVLYLLHGAFDCDASWSSVGQAGQILDNLIAAGKAKPMLVVMPMGHTGRFAFGPNGDFEKQMSNFAVDFQQEIKSLIEHRYRVSSNRERTAIAGLSMEGAQTLNFALANLDQFAYVGVCSSGVFGIKRGDGERLRQAYHLEFSTPGPEEYNVQDGETVRMLVAVKKPRSAALSALRSPTKPKPGAYCTCDSYKCLMVQTGWICDCR